MTGTQHVPRTLHVHWHVAPLHAPQPCRHCSTCGTPRPFQCSGKVRLNANGRRLDAWLIYRCTACDRTWNLPLMTRVPVAEVPPADLTAMEISDPDWVRARAFDAVTLRRHATRVLWPPGVLVTEGQVSLGPVDFSRIVLTVHAEHPTGERLDRLLAQRLGLSRSALRKLEDCGGLALAGGASRSLGAILSGTVVLHFDLDPIAADAGLAITRSLGLPAPGAG